MRLVLAAAVALAASPVAAEIIGMQRCILGGDEGFFRCDAPTGEDTLTIDALPYERTVTCDDITLTGTATGGGAVTWSASPSGASGSCTGTASWSCLVDVDPDASGEGVETITVSQSGGGTDTVDVGFYVDGAHSCFLAQSVDGSYNSTLANLDPVATWENLGTSALDVTQATAANQPTFRTSIVAGQPVVRCDGGDRVVAATAIDWAFMNNAADWTLQAIYATAVANPNAYQPVAGTNLSGSSSSRGHGIWHEDRVSVPANDRARSSASNGTAPLWQIVAADGGLPAEKFNDHMLVHDNDGGAGADAFQFSNYVADGSAIVTIAYSALAPVSALRFCSDGTAFLTGDLFRALIYQSALTATQRGINQDVDEWALGGTLPVTP